MKLFYNLGPETFFSRKRTKKGDKGGKGLRHFSMKVCEKVQRKGVTSYNEVADELVNEFSDPRNMNSPSEAVSCFHENKELLDTLICFGISLNLCTF